VKELETEWEEKNNFNGILFYAKERRDK